MLVSGQVSAFGQPYGPYLQTDAEPDTQVDDQPCSPFLVSICQKEGYIVKVKLNPLVFLSIKVIEIQVTFFLFYLFLILIVLL